MSNDAPRPDGQKTASRFRPQSFRARHRARAHEDAHAADGGDAHDAPVHSFPLVPKGQPQLITDDAGLTALLTHLRAAGTFAYDSEFIGELTYVPKLCLVQVATSERVALIDPLADIDLTPFWELLTDPSVLKVVHAGDQDVEPVVRILGKGPANVFDTQIATGMVALPYPLALGKLVGELVGQRLGKGLTFTHWDQRPLSPMQLRYAADDVRYLVAAHAELARRLEANGHAAWVREECDAMCEPSQYKFNPQTAHLRVRGSGTLAPRNLNVLRELTVWRDGCARAHDVPPRALLKDEILIDMARQPVKSLEKLDRVRGLPRPIEEAHGTELVEATMRGLEAPVGKGNGDRDDEPTPAQRFAADALYAAAAALAIAEGVDVNLIASRQEIGELSRTLEAGGDVSGLKIMTGWRRQALGDPLVRLYGGEQPATLRWESGRLRR